MIPLKNELISQKSDKDLKGNLESSLVNYCNIFFENYLDLKKIEKRKS